MNNDEDEKDEKYEKDEINDEECSDKEYINVQTRNG